jgi:hypothetical protein
VAEEVAAALSTLEAFPLEFALERWLQVRVYYY